MPFSVLPTSACERVLAKLKGVKPAGSGQWMALCPAHDDSERSLSIKQGSDGRAVMYCHARCQTLAIVTALGLTWADTFADGTKPPNGTAPAAVAPAQGVESRPKLIKSYDYTDADGALLFQTCRLEPKSFRQRRKGDDGKWIWNLDGVSPVLYRLPEVLEAVAAEKRIYVVEGEKDADALAGLGFTATTSPMGAGKWRERYADALAGAEVVVFPDNDEPGQSHARDVAASLTARGCTVRVVNLPGIPPKGDFSNWNDAQGDLDDLEDLITRTAPWTDPAAPRRTRWVLEEIWANESIMRPPPPVVPYLAWSARSTLLAAREKSGKSTLTGYISAQVSRGGEFLGEPCEHGKVLIIGLEEFIGDTARRLKAFGANGKLIELVTGFAGEATDRPSEVRAHIEAVAPVLVILDSLMAYAKGVINDANNSTQTQAAVQALTTVAHETGAALVIIHHARKSDGKYRDSSAIGGAVDIIAEVFPPDENTDPTRRRVRPVGRVPAREVDFRFTGHSYTLIDPTGPQKPPLDQRIELVVRERPGISANDVVRAVEDARERVLERVRLLLTNGRLINDGDARSMKLRVPTFTPAAALL